MFRKLRVAISWTLLLLICGNLVVGQRVDQKKAPALTDPTIVLRYQQLITPEGLSARLYFLASDFFEGRETGTRGQRLAAHYLASQYRQLGLTPKGTELATDPLSASPFFQPFTVYRRIPKQSHLEVTIDNRQVASSTFSATAHDDLAFFFNGGFANANAGVVFAGYGIADDKLGYNDYAALSAAGISITDKWVLMLEDEPLADANTSLLSTTDHKPSSWSTQFISKKAALWKAGRPKGVLVVSDVTPLETMSFEERGAQASQTVQRIGIVSLFQNTDFPPTFSISTKLANQLLAPSGHTVAELKKQIDTSLKPVAFDLGARVRVNAQVEPFEGLRTENVLAFIEGVDPKLKDEVVIISAHYDHLGIDPTLKGDQIFNGAADDGSGVIACLEMAQWFMKAKREGAGPRRSILFINFSGEEKGTLGSNYYSNSPIVPWERTVAEINMDGVGGIDAKHPNRSKNYIYVIGRDDLSSELISTAKQLNVSLGTNLELTEGRRFNSDQQNFEAQFVPYIYYSTGLTEKYHQVGDEADTIDYGHFARVVQLVFATAWALVNQDTRPRSVERNRLTLAGYICPPCSFSCDEAVHDHPGECPVCGMAYRPKYVVNNSIGE